MAKFPAGPVRTTACPARSFAVSAPGSWDAPWGGEYEFAPLHGILYEYACNEGNYALPGILAGARAHERDAGQGSAAKTAGGAN